MKPILVLVAVWLCGVAGGLVAGERTRPVRDDVGFCWRAAEMDRLVQYLETQAAGRPPSFPVVAGVAPHDDYLYAGRVAWSVLSRIEAPEVIIFGVTHGTVRREIGDPQGVVLLDTFARWAGPYGPVAVSPLRERLRRELPAAMVRDDDRA
ncbi:MAG TPA: AmmeMemoRadiSam system protein B, partial [Candidatus Aminicenantes bacterium]|nr:AmmeMemoRadiSam system protein B [Candidatus Aminicenantes bacterium]